MVLNTISCADQAIEDADYFTGLDRESGLLLRLTYGSFAQQFPHFEHAAGNRPFTEEGRMTPLHQEHAPILDNDGADTDQRSFGIFAS